MRVKENTRRNLPRIVKVLRNSRDVSLRYVVFRDSTRTGVVYYNFMLVYMNNRKDDHALRKLANLRVAAGCKNSTRIRHSYRYKKVRFSWYKNVCAAVTWESECIVDTCMHVSVYEAHYYVSRKHDRINGELWKRKFHVLSGVRRALDNVTEGR